MPFDLSLPPKLWLPPKPAIIRALSREELVLASFLPGMFPGAAAAAAAAPLTTLTQVDSASDTGGAAFTLPDDILAGDLIVVYDYAISLTSTLPTSAVPSGFTPAIDAPDAVSFGTRSILSYKIAVGTESSASVNGMDATLGESKLTYVFRGDVPITSVFVGSPLTHQNTANPTPQVVTAGGGTPPLVVLGCYATSVNTVNPRTFTVAGSAAKDGEINVTPSGGSSDVWLAYKIYNSAPADVTIDMDDKGFNTLLSCYLACS